MKTDLTSPAVEEITDSVANGTSTARALPDSKKKATASAHDPKHPGQEADFRCGIVDCPVEESVIVTFMAFPPSESGFALPPLLRKAQNDFNMRSSKREKRRSAMVSARYAVDPRRAVPDRQF
jgi:hypothetical protein